MEHYDDGRTRYETTINWKFLARLILVAVIVMMALSNLPQARAVLSSSCGDGEALVSISYWRGTTGSTPKVSDLLDSCWWRGVAEKASMSAPRLLCAAGSHDVGNGKCCLDGYHSSGENKCSQDTTAHN